MDKTAALALFAWLDREIWLLTAQAGSRRGGLIATFVNQASIAPDLPRMVVGVARQHFTWQLIEQSQSFALHLLSADNLDWVYHFGLQSGHEVDKFNDWTTETALTGSPLLANTIGWLDCQVEASLDIGDRTLYVGEVVQSQVSNYGPPLTVKQLMQAAPADKISVIKRLFHQDSTLDAEAILAWRQQRQAAGENRS